MTCVFLTNYCTRPSNRESLLENIGEVGDDQKGTPIDVRDYNLLYYNLNT